MGHKTVTTWEPEEGDFARITADAKPHSGTAGTLTREEETGLRDFLRGSVVRVNEVCYSQRAQSTCVFVELGDARFWVEDYELEDPAQGQGADFDHTAAYQQAVDTLPAARAALSATQAADAAVRAAQAEQAERAALARLQAKYGPPVVPQPLLDAAAAYRIAVAPLAALKAAKDAASDVAFDPRGLPTGVQNAHMAFGEALDRYNSQAHLVAGATAALCAAALALPVPEATR